MGATLLRVRSGSPGSDSGDRDVENKPPPHPESWVPGSSSENRVERRIEERCRLREL